MLRMYDARIASARGEKDRLRVVSREQEVTTQYRHVIVTSIALKKQRRRGRQSRLPLTVSSENISRARHSRDYSPSTRVRTKAPGKTNNLQVTSGVRNSSRAAQGYRLCWQVPAERRVSSITTIAIVLSHIR